MRKFLSVLIMVLSFAVVVSAQSKNFERGLRAANEGKFEQALEKFQTSLAKTENSSAEFLAKLHYNIGVCQFQLNRLTEAVENYQRAIELSEGKYQRAFYALGMAQARAKNWQVAREAFQTAIRLTNGRDGEAWFDLAMVFVAEQDFFAAAEAFQKAIQFNSTDAPAAHNNFGVILALQHKFSAAEKEFETALLKADGKLPEADNNLQFCRSRLEGQTLTAKLMFVTPQFF